MDLRLFLIGLARDLVARGLVPIGRGARSYRSAARSTRSRCSF